MRYRDMTLTTLHRTLCASAAAAALTLSGAAWGAQGDTPEHWSKMREQVVGADDILGGDVTSGVRQIGEVTELVLTPDGSAVQYVLYEVPYPFRVFGGERGFAAFEGIDFRAAAGADVGVHFVDAGSHRAPEELRLSASEADHRLVSELLGDPLHFSDGETRTITDVLVDRETSTLTHFVVDMEAQSLFDMDRRSIPADMVEINKGGTVTASMRISGVDEILQQYDPGLL